MLKVRGASTYLAATDWTLEAALRALSYFSLLFGFGFSDKAVPGNTDRNPLDQNAFTRRGSTDGDVHIQFRKLWQ
jgi:hypothetical protein